MLFFNKKKQYGELFWRNSFRTFINVLWLLLDLAEIIFSKILVYIYPHRYNSRGMLL